MLVSFFFFNDAVITATNNYSIYMERVFAVPDKTKSLLLMAILVMSAIGGIVVGWMGDKIGILKTLKLTLLGWIIALPAVAFAPNFTIFVVVTVFIGFLLGSSFTAARAYMSTLLSSEEMGYGFSFYTLFERFATFIGPMTWGGIIWFFGTSPFSYKIAMTSMTVFVVIGFLILSMWRKKKYNL
jgi:MFS-type transporter involved in bile tolerance (Atg22 family)